MGHCFDCQIEYENKLRVKGEFDDWAERKMLENQKAYLKDLEQSIDDFEKTGGKQEWLNQVGINTPELEKEKWEMGEDEFEKTITDARDFIISVILLSRVLPPLFSCLPSYPTCI